MPESSNPRFPLALSSELLDALLATADLGGVGISVVAIDVDPPQCLFVNKGIAEVLHYSIPELLAKPIWELIAPNVRPDVLNRYKDRFSRPPRRDLLEVWLLRKDGVAIPFQTTTCRVTVGGRPANATFLVDVSERVESAAALAASEGRFRTAVESAPDGVVILRGPNILYANSRAATLLANGDVSGILGHSVLDYLQPEDALRAHARIMALFRSGQRHSEPAEYRTRSSNGPVNAVEISSVPIEFEGAPAVLAFARDVTERRAMHEKMVQADRLAAVGTLAAGIAHEINNPLAYVLLGLQYLQRELPSVAHDPSRLPEALARLGEVRNGAERVGTIVRDLKTFARADEVARGPVDVESVVEAALKIADHEIRHRARLLRDYAPVPPVDANAARLEQVFLNLLVNAAHAVSDGDPESNAVTLSIRPGRGATVTVEVTDNGSGIAADVLHRVFDPFFTTKPIGVGTGLGLPICRSIVESFGGEIELESEPGTLTTARVTLPAHTKELPRLAPKAPPASSRPASSRTRILVIDDEPLVAELLRRLLAAEHDVVVATSGREALTTLETSPFDAIVCDVMMPGMTGMELYAALSSKNEELAKSIVFMTGGAFVPRVAEFLSAIDNPKIEKPFDLGQLTAALRRARER